MEETMQSDASSSQSLLPKADQVRKKCLVWVFHIFLILQIVFIQILQSLATKVDPIRREYWLFLSRFLNSQFAN